jgi:hypothetical protein
MIFHILANAIKFNKESRGKIDITLAYKEDMTKVGGSILTV